MWTREELEKIRMRVEQEAFIQGINNSWRHACLDWAAAIDRVDVITARIELGLEFATLQQANEV